MTTHAILWQLAGRRGYTRAFLVAGDVLIVLYQNVGSEVEARPILAATHNAAVKMALDLTGNSELGGMVLTTKPRAVEIPDYQPAHLYSAQMLAGTSVAPLINKLLDRMVVEGVSLDDWEES